MKRNKLHIDFLMELKFILIIMPVLTISLANAQTIKTTISGKITSKNETPIEFANVYLKSTLTGVISDKSGYFELHTNAESRTDTLVVSAIGYSEKKLSVNLNKSIQLTVKMAEKNAEINEITVRASSFTAGDKKGATLKSMDVLKTPGAAADVFVAIQDFPGVQQVGEGAGLYVRGGDISETMVMLDGAYIHHPYKYESPNGGYFGTISPFLLKDIYFSSGGYGVEYGHSISGILSMKSIDNIEQRKYHANLGLAGAGFRIEQPVIYDVLSISSSYNITNSSLLFKLNGHAREFLSFPTSQDQNLNIFYKYSKTGSVKLFLYGEKDKVSVLTEDPTLPLKYSGMNNSRMANFVWNEVRSKLSLNANAAISIFNKDENTSDMDFNTKDYLFQFRFSGLYAFSEKINSLTGVEILKNQQNINGSIPTSYFNSDFDFIPTDDTIFVYDIDFNGTTTGLFQKFSFSYLPKSIVSIGGRLEFYTNNSTPVFDLRSSLSQNLSERWYYVLSIGKYHQYPEPKLYDKYTGNPALRELSATHITSGFSYRYMFTIFSIDGYYKVYDNLLTSDTVVNYLNEGYGYARGIDVFLKNQHNKFKYRISLSLLDTKRKWLNTKGLYPTKFDIRINTTAVCDYTFNENWFISSKYKFATGKPYTSKPNTYHNARTPYYHKWDVALNYKFYITGLNTISVAYISADNITGRKNIFNYIYDDSFTNRVPVTSAMLRSFYAGIQLTF